VAQPTAGHLELEFTNVTADDAGNYTCASRNSVSVDEVTALLTVQCMYMLCLMDYVCLVDAASG